VIHIQMALTNEIILNQWCDVESSIHTFINTYLVLSKLSDCSTWKSQVDMALSFCDLLNTKKLSKRVYSINTLPISPTPPAQPTNEKTNEDTDNEFDDLDINDYFQRTISDYVKKEYAKIDRDKANKVPYTLTHEVPYMDSIKPNPLLTPSHDKPSDDVKPSDKPAASTQSNFLAELDACEKERMEYIAKMLSNDPLVKTYTDEQLYAISEQYSAEFDDERLIRRMSKAKHDDPPPTSNTIKRSNVKADDSEEDCEVIYEEFIEEPSTPSVPIETLLLNGSSDSLITDFSVDASSIKKALNSGEKMVELPVIKTQPTVVSQDKLASLSASERNLVIEKIYCLACDTVREDPNATDEQVNALADKLLAEFNAGEFEF